MRVIGCVQITGFDVYKHNGLTMLGEYKGFVPSITKTHRLQAISHLVMHTHMGEWKRYSDGSYEYATTTGVYLRFHPIKREITDVSGDTYE